MRLGVHEFVERYALLGARVVEAAYRRAAHDAELDQERSVCKALIMAIQVDLWLLLLVVVVCVDVHRNAFKRC